MNTILLCDDVWYKYEYVIVDKKMFKFIKLKVKMEKNPASNGAEVYRL